MFIETRPRDSIMAQLTAFAYYPGNTLLHRIDIRVKLLVIIVLDIISLQSGIQSLIFLSLPILLALLILNLRIRQFIWEMRYLAIFLCFIWLSRVISWQDEQAIIYYSIPISIPGVLEGFIVCWRLVIIILAGLLFVFSSGPMEIIAAIVWFLKPIPLVPEKRIAIMISLMIRFLPEILKQSAEISEAQEARGIENRKNPIFRVVAHSVPLFRKIFEIADDLVTAMEARSYSEIRTYIKLQAKPLDWIFIASAIFYFTVLWILPSQQFMAI